MSTKALYYTETTANVNASTTFDGSVRSMVDPPHNHRQYFNAVAFSSHAGTLKVLASFDGGSTYIEVDTVAVSAGVPAKLKTPIIADLMRARYVNGGTNTTTFALATALTDA